MAVSMIGVAMVQTGLVPSKIATFGIELEKPNRNSLLFLLAVVTAYFLVAFILYAISDYVTRREAIRAAEAKAFEAEMWYLAAGKADLGMIKLKQEYEETPTKYCHEKYFCSPRE